MNKKNTVKVLVVDDESFIQELICDFLEEEGVECDCSGTLERSLELARAGSYDLVLLDRHLDVTVGSGTIESFNKLQPGVPVLLITGDHLMSEKEAREIGAAGVVHKPFKVDEFLNSIGKFLEI